MHRPGHHHFPLLLEVAVQYCASHAFDADSTNRRGPHDFGVFSLEGVGAEIGADVPGHTVSTLIPALIRDRRRHLLVGQAVKQLRAVAGALGRVLPAEVDERDAARAREVRRPVVGVEGDPVGSGELVEGRVAVALHLVALRLVALEREVLAGEGRAVERQRGGVGEDVSVRGGRLTEVAEGAETGEGRHHGPSLRFFVALAQAAGFDSGLVWIAPRNQRIFEPAMQDRRMLDDFIVWVHAGDKDYFLDPGAALCPFGMLPWYETGITEHPSQNKAQFSYPCP